MTSSIILYEARHVDSNGCHMWNQPKTFDSLEEIRKHSSVAKNRAASEVLNRKKPQMNEV